MMLWRIEKVDEPSGCGRLIVHLILLGGIWFFIADWAECGPFAHRPVSVERPPMIQPPTR
jgi:hypothetical protein